MEIIDLKERIRYEERKNENGLAKDLKKLYELSAMKACQNQRFESVDEIFSFREKMMQLMTMQ